MKRAFKVARSDGPDESPSPALAVEEEDLGSEVLGEYFRRRGDSLPGVEDRNELDPIDPSYIAGVRINHPKDGRPLLGKSMKHVPWLRVPLEILSGAQPPCPVQMPRSLITVPERKPNSKFMDDQIPKLSVEGGLLVKRERNDRQANVRGLCALFSVLKRNGFHRIVYNGQQGNALLQRPEGLRIFLLEHLHEAIRRWGPYWTVSLDYRHHFYQIPMPREASRYFAVEANKRGSDGSFNQYFPRAIPMGWHTAPLLGQAVTWAITLYRRPEESPLGVHPEILEHTEMPEFVSLWRNDQEIGRIFVLLDGVAILTEDKELAELWRRRLDRNSDTFKCVIKNESEDKTARGRSQIVSGSREEGVTFAGINWRGTQAARIGV
jgi:hypothetical protein